MISRHTLAAFIAVFLLNTLSFSQPADAPVMPISDLKAGQRGEVWTVFKGSNPEPFSVQVTGVIENALGPGKNLILCELTDPRVQNMGAVAGMSGSPLYIDGHIVGVLSYQIQRFETVRYAGFTPISDMLEVSALPSAFQGPGGTPIPIRGLRDGRSGKVSAEDFSPMTPAFSVAGLSPEVAAAFSSQFSALGLGAVGLGGHADGGSNPSLTVTEDLKPGDVVAAALSVGDVSVAATGTVSHVDGNRILAFGHPMLSLGETELPMTAAKVVTILPSQLNSIKVSNTGQVIGSFSQDRLSGIYGEIGRAPHLVPIDVELPARLSHKTLHFAVVRHEQVLPVIAAAGLTQAVSGSNEAGFTHGFRLVTTVEFPGAEPFTMSQYYPGPQGFQQGVSDFVTRLQQCLYNPFERTFPDHIRFSVEETPEVPLGFIENFQVSRAQAEPGARITATVNWHGFQETPQSETLTIPVAPEWAGKELDVVLVPGPMLDEMTGHPRNPSVSDYRNFDDFLAAQRHHRETDGMYLAVVEHTRLFSDQHSLTPDMPASLERIAHRSDDTRFQRRDAVTALWESNVLSGRVFTTQYRKSLQVTD
ncbi:MAG TPA: SpoIVB peptidase S55 domain-containing protein [Candidatus Didemnitutus sp.]|nr:SpoIVB peptidase S55 domain-containing protein [Candidatus Didemnitutus sp.]